MKVNAQKLEALLIELAKTTGYEHRCAATSVFVGEIDGKLVRLSIMEQKHAKDNYDYTGPGEMCICIEAQQRTDNAPCGGRP